MEKAKNYNIFVFSFVTLTIISYFFGFTINENSAGGGEVDFKNTWRNFNINFASHQFFCQTNLMVPTTFRARFQSIPGAINFFGTGLCKKGIG